jgi:hypothetical protein
MAIRGRAGGHQRDPCHKALAVVHLPAKAFEAEHEHDASNCSWTTTSAGVRRYAERQAADVRADLNAWAGLIEGLAQLDNLAGK